MRAYNDPDNDLVLIKPYPSEYLIVPKGTKRRKRPSENALSIEQLRTFITADLDAIPLRGRKERKEARAICMLSFCTAGTNIADLYEFTEEHLKDGKLAYYRRKVRDRRADGGYIEFAFTKEARHYLNQLQEGKAEGMLTNMSARHSDHTACSKHLIKTLRTITKALGLPHITPYTYRYTFATIARNECGVDMEDLAFALNHVALDPVTDGYVKKDYTRINKVINKVLRFVFDV